MGTEPTSGDGDRGRPGDDEVWDTSMLDEHFVESAPVVEGSALERLERRRIADDERRVLEHLAHEEEQIAAVERMRRRRLIRFAAALVLVALLAGFIASLVRPATTDTPVDDRTTPTEATASATTTTVASVIARRPFGMNHLDRTDVRVAADGSRRELRSEVWVPLGTGPFPVIAFAHGNDGNPNKFHQLFAAWAAAGYAVVAPRFPVSADDANQDLAASVADAPEQPLDLQFVVGQVLSEDAVAASADQRPGTFDTRRLAVAGLSLGGGTALQASYSDCCPALAPKLVMAFSPVPFATQQPATAPPLLLMHGSDDRTLPYQGSQDYFGSAANERWFVTLTGAGHSPPYEDSASPYDQLVRIVSVDFLDEFLLARSDGVTEATAAVTNSGLATIQSAG